MEEQVNGTNTETTKKHSGLIPFKKGQSGNPNGRPKKEKCIVSLIDVYLSFTPAQLGVKDRAVNLNMAHHLAIKYLLDCHEHPNHIDSLMNRLYGQPKQEVENTVIGDINIDAKGKLLSLLNRSASRTGAAESNSKP